MNSILTSIKQMLGITEDYTHFDTDIIIHINTVFGILNNMGVGNKKFTITDKNATWSQFIGSEPTDLELVKTYIYLKVKLIFDPPASSSVLEAYKTMASELEWRLYAEYNYQDEDK